MLRVALRLRFPYLACPSSLLASRACVSCFAFRVARFVEPCSPLAFGKLLFARCNPCKHLTVLSFFLPNYTVRIRFALAVNRRFEISENVKLTSGTHCFCKRYPINIAIVIDINMQPELSRVCVLGQSVLSTALSETLLNISDADEPRLIIKKLSANTASQQRPHRPRLTLAHWDKLNELRCTRWILCVFDAACQRCCVCVTSLRIRKYSLCHWCLLKLHVVSRAFALAYVYRCCVFNLM